MLVLVLLLAAPALISAILFGGGGGGGGCGCAPQCPPPCPPIQLPQPCLPQICIPRPPPLCLPSIPTCPSCGGGGGGCGGGCGRKKRSATLELVSGDSSVPGKAMCNSPSLRKFILKNMGADPATSKAQIHSELKARLPGNSYVVICSQGPFSIVADAEKFCVDGSASQTCYVFQV